MSVLVPELESFKKENALLTERLSAVSGNHPSFKLPVQYTDLEIVRTERSETKNETMYRQCIKKAFARLDNDSVD